MQELELMRSVGTGDPAAMTRLIEEHYDPIFRVLRHVSGSREDAQDLAQEVFLIARTKGVRFKGQSTVRTWLTRIALNECSRLRRRDALRALWPRPATVQTAANDMVDSEWLLAGLRKLSYVHRVALLLFEVHGFSVGEIADITGSPEGTVKARLHYARARLRTILVCEEEHS